MFVHTFSGWVQIRAQPAMATSTFNNINKKQKKRRNTTLMSQNPKTYAFSPKNSFCVNPIPHIVTCKSTTFAWSWDYNFLYFGINILHPGAWLLFDHDNDQDKFHTSMSMYISTKMFERWMLQMGYRLRATWACILECEPLTFHSLSSLYTFRHG